MTNTNHIIYIYIFAGDSGGGFLGEAEWGAHEVLIINSQLLDCSGTHPSLGGNVVEDLESILDLKFECTA